MIEIHHVAAFAPEIDTEGEYFLVVLKNEETDLHVAQMLLHTEELRELHSQIDQVLKGRQEEVFTQTLTAEVGL